MPESEPSAPLPVGASIRFALAAAIRRAERAERERDDAFERADGWHFGHEVWKGRALAAEAELDQARAQLARVEALPTSIRTLADGTRVAYVTRDDLRAALDPVGATEDEAKP